MQPDALLASRRTEHVWKAALTRLGVVALGLLAMTAREWGEMAYQWWNIDTYSHILLIPPIVVWLAWLRRDELAQETPMGWWPGLGLFGLALSLWLLGRVTGLNLVAHAGAVAALASLVPAILGLRVALLLAFPLVFMAFLVPFGEEIVAPLQFITAEIAVALTRLSGVEAAIDGLYIDTEAGLFVVAEACAGVQFVVAMVALGTLTAMTGFSTWKRRALFLLACIVIPILTNGIRAWATIFIAQYIGAEAATGFDHIVYGWIFFGIVIAIVLGLAWRWFDRAPEDAGWRREQIVVMPLVRHWEGRALSPFAVTASALALVILFAVAGLLV